MALPPRAELHDILQFRPHPVGDPVPWWLLQELDKGVLSQLAQISLVRQKEELAAQTKAIDAAIGAIAGKAAGKV
jgi:hypothetical protein